jgi:hypothetical protein
VAIKLGDGTLCACGVAHLKTGARSLLKR